MSYIEIDLDSFELWVEYGIACLQKYLENWQLFEDLYGK